MSTPAKNQKLAIGIAAAVVLACCGATVGPFALGDEDKKPSAAPTTAAPTAQTQRLVDAGTPTPDPATTTAVADPTSAAPATTRPSVKPSPKPVKTTSAPRSKATTKPPTRKSSPTPTKRSVRQGVHPGAFCTPQGARGVTVTGKPMVCTTTARDERKRWRAA